MVSEKQVPDSTVEPRSEKLPISVTPSEHHKAHAVAKFDRVEGGASNLPRYLSLQQIFARYDEIQAYKPPSPFESARKSERPESRSEKLTLPVTATEYESAHALAMIDEVEGGVSGMFRVMSLHDILRRHAEITAATPPLPLGGSVPVDTRDLALMVANDATEGL